MTHHHPLLRCLYQQVRRSSFKNAVNAADISRFGADLGGVQQYTLNGNKIIYLVGWWRECVGGGGGD